MNNKVFKDYKRLTLYLILCILISFFLYGVFQLLNAEENPMEDWITVNLEVEAALKQEKDQVVAEIVVNHDISIDIPAEPLLLNLNTAEAYQLETLPGIGPVKAKAIVDYRVQHGKFASIEEVMQVNGIGRVTLENIQEWITVDD